MDVNKINDNLLEIKLSEEELYFDYNLEIKDLTNPDIRNEVSKILVDVVIKAAQGYNMPLHNGLHLDIHISSLNEIVLEAHFNSEFNLNNISGIAKFFKSLYARMPKEEAEEVIKNTIKQLHLNQEQLNEILDIMKELDALSLEEFKEQNKENLPSENYLYVVETNNFNNLINASKLLLNCIEKSKLYKYDTKYCLELHIKPDTDEYVINIFTEYLLKRKDDLYLSFVNEHGEVIIKNNAIKILSEL